MRSFLHLAFLLLILPAAHAQQTIYEESRVPYKKEVYGGILLHGDGWGLQFYHAKYNTARDRRLLGVEIVGMKHPKEVKSFKGQPPEGGSLIGVYAASPKESMGTYDFDNFKVTAVE